ncbi:nucleotide disphospho-sugar-binding domain-containing protein [Streptomyces qinglanensis]|uniref:nucleotide disphospho-sugar-binding domain-containing protein n=1 Tax=Streptomyces qinglanensis TaxID=943816 RepID=UPI003D71EE55
MRVLFVGPPLYGLLYPVLSLAQAFRTEGHEVVVASAGQFTRRVAEAGLVGFDAAPELDSEAEYRQGEDRRKRLNLGTRMGRFSFFGDEMADALVDFAGEWRPDLIVYPPLGVAGPLVAAKYDVPVVMQTVGFGHQRHHIEGVTRSMEDAYARHGVAEPRPDLLWLDIAPPSMRVLDEPDLWSMRYVPFNGGTVLEDWWSAETGRPRVVVSLGTLKPMVDGIDLIKWVVESAHEYDAQFVLSLGEHGQREIDSLPDNVRLVSWVPMGPLLGRASGFIHHGGAGNTLTALSAGVPQIVFGQGADRPANAKTVQDRGCGFVPGAEGLVEADIDRLLTDTSLRVAATQVRAEMRAQDPPTVIARRLARLVASGERPGRSAPAPLTEG